MRDANGKRPWETGYTGPKVAMVSAGPEDWEVFGELFTGLRAIIERADNGELGTSKVQDMRRIAVALLAKHGGGQ
ncbi:hypothetical protein [Rhizobium laguerreae]|uniref:hypothetical protein n=1 Tax=Rhizobium laguerreae TaxID=1076926 RepID=UPI001C906F2F|nr:hypothetical protein [Rhizobium laguerreae]MBY3434873.1 hypothetical protein [Rhizobium laguerreae]MBY3449015.1 hypothetical protein [Rhizobium laguerreae]MBY3456789.1 hypothetical protein [Rhizobium laguerreae]